MSDDIRIYVADLAAYNNGKLHGVWVDATAEIDDIWSAVHAMLARSPESLAEEWGIHDYEGFGPIRLSEWECFERVREIALFIEEYPLIGAVLIDHYGGEVDEARRAADESYSGVYTSLAAYAEELTNETTQIPDNLTYYIDDEQMGRDMELNGDIYTLKTAYAEVHVLWSH